MGLIFSQHSCPGLVNALFVMAPSPITIHFWHYFVLNGSPLVNTYSNYCRFLLPSIKVVWYFARTSLGFYKVCLGVFCLKVFWLMTFGNLSSIKQKLIDIPLSWSLKIMVELSKLCHVMAFSSKVLKQWKVSKPKLPCDGKELWEMTTSKTKPWCLNKF